MLNLLSCLDFESKVVTKIKSKKVTNMRNETHSTYAILSIVNGLTLKILMTEKTNKVNYNCKV